MPPMPLTTGCGRVGCYGPVVDLPARASADALYWPGLTCLGCCGVDAIPANMVPEWRPDEEARARRRFDEGCRQHEARLDAIRQRVVGLST